MYYVYVLRSQKDGKLYKGSTGSLERRLSNHNSGKVKATKNRKPLIIVHTEAFNTQEEAINREKYLKTFKGGKELAKIINNP
jgi:putative endonuclease